MRCNSEALAGMAVTGKAEKRAIQKRQQKSLLKHAVIAA